VTAVPRVATASGDIAGSTVRAVGGRAVRHFLGIPYAASPTGDLRWRAPIPPRPWRGVRDATTFAPAAPQRGALESRLPGFSPDVPTSEDCLALNVWTPRLDGRRPVLVWFPGGAYLSGGTAQPVYDAARLADEGDLVVVTVGYRLGALGFLAPGGDGAANCGLRDQLAALAWVREHASTFGGDPRCITVMGESAGAGSVLHLLASPARGDVFDRAIAQSGQPLTLDADAAAEVAHTFATTLGIESASADALRTLPVEQRRDAPKTTLDAMLGKVGPMAFAPSIDDEIVAGAVLDGVAAGRASDVELVLGTTRDELALFPDPRAATLDDERLLRRIGALGPVVEPAEVLARYREQLGPEASSGAVWDAVRTDAMRRVPNLRVADAHAAGDGATFVYRFDWSAPGLGAAHAVDVPFTFGTFDREGWGEVVGYDQRAEALAESWRGSWAACAARGDPRAAWGRNPERRAPTRVAVDRASRARDAAAETPRCRMIEDRAARRSSTTRHDSR
jgi:para-nitrobenzyl esterase